MLHSGRRTQHELALLCHHIETDILGLQCGIQDQLCAAYGKHGDSDHRINAFEMDNAGGVLLIEMFQYPHAHVSQLQLERYSAPLHAPMPSNGKARDVRWELERRLLLLYLGKSHSSSDVHKV